MPYFTHTSLWQHTSCTSPSHHHMYVVHYHGWDASSPPHTARLWACRWMPQMTSESADLTHGFTIAFFNNAEGVHSLPDEFFTQNLMCWAGLEMDTQCRTDFKGLLISFKMFLDLTPCFYSSTTDHDGGMDGHQSLFNVNVPLWSSGK